MAQLTSEEGEALAYLRSSRAIRERCEQLLLLASNDRLDHFRYAPDKLVDVVDYVVSVMRETYPTLDIPLHSRWRHFNTGGVDRLQQLGQLLAPMEIEEQARCRFELVITSVLLDAGAGEQWAYYEESSKSTYTRSEGLAVASFHMFLDGGFSSRLELPLQADADGLRSLTASRLADAFQVTPDNPLVGLAGRVELLQALGHAVAQTPEVFGASAPRLGCLFDSLRNQAVRGVLPADVILKTLLDCLSSIWPDRLSLGGANLGDVWSHSKLRSNPLDCHPDLTAGLVPFHKLSQWLTYSLIEPLQDAGLDVVDLDALTGLAEYRNGGLFLDMGVITPKDQAVLTRAHLPESELVVEWRGLTVALLDQVAEQVRQTLGLTPDELPLGSVLEGGTWRAGRQIAAQLRADGSPPLRITSNGTVF